MKTRIGVIGTGYISRIHTLAVQKCAQAELTTVMDIQPEQMKKFAFEFNIPYQYSDFDLLVKESGVDAIVIGVPNIYHAPMTIAALEAGISVLVEKPMAVSPEEGEIMVAASRKVESLGVQLMVAHCWRFDNEVQWLRQQVDAGSLGDVIRTKGYGVHAQWGPVGWFTQKKYAGGGALADMGIHAIDTARYLLGDPRPLSVYARIGIHYGKYDVDDTDVLIVNWENGAYSYIEAGWWQPHTDFPEAGTQLFGTKGYGQVFPTFLDPYIPAQPAKERINSGFPITRPEHCEQGMYDRQMEYFIDCIQKKTTPIPGGQEGLTNLRIMAAAFESAKTGSVEELILKKK
jgi:predicted dehydrogenase